MTHINEFDEVTKEAKSFTIEWAEGLTSVSKQFPKVYKDKDSLAQSLWLIAVNAPKDGSYNKVKVVIEHKDGTKLGYRFDVVSGDPFEIGLFYGEI